MELKLPLYLERGLGENSGIVKDADGNEVRGELDEVKAIIIRAVNAEEAHRKDSERLDWMDSVNKNINKRNGNEYGWKWDVNHNRACLSDCNWPPLSVREAIDQAMNSVKTASEKALGMGGSEL